jgi:hypothetical protein
MSFGGGPNPPYVEMPYAKWIINVHWSDEPKCEGESTITGKWGFVGDPPDLVQDIVGGGGGAMIGVYMTNNGLFMGVENNTQECNAPYYINTLAIGASGEEHFSDGGTLPPGSAFFAGIRRGGLFALEFDHVPSQGRVLILGSEEGQYQYAEFTVWSKTVES